MIEQEKYGNPIIVVIFITLLDQVTKYFVRISLYPREFFPIAGKFIGFTNILNSGSLFGLFRGANSFLVLFSVIVLGVISYYWDGISYEDVVPFSLILGGILGNLIDRIIYSSVTDFISIGLWPSFNVADSAITIGILWLAINELRR